MTRRRLTPDEVALWRDVSAKVERLHPERAAPAITPKPKPTPTKSTAARFAPFEVGSAATTAPPRHNLKPALAERFSGQSLKMDRGTYRRMARGKLSPEARLDLHGMTLDRAHASLNRFILLAQASGKRLVLVITGKGRTGGDDGPIPRPRGVLKHQVPHWLETPPLAQAVQQIAPAHASHGGSGAYYVYLRRAR